ncbi:hypothetical protein ACFPLB_04405 [Aquamicrobium segne]|uniref:Uncharacterized protein n=1 Tax=Aquamicrobium segne TaxID=469547 RepID=A0ABW0GU79_9HYPH
MDIPSIFQRAYYTAPILVQNVLFSALCAAQDRKRYSHHYKEKFDWLLETEWWDKDRIKAYQIQKTNEIIKHASRNVPFYKELYGLHGISSRQIQNLTELKDFPIISKENARASMQEMYALTASRKTITTRTSGTTGSPLVIKHSPDSLAFQWALWWRHRHRFGWQRGERFLTVGARVPVHSAQVAPPYWREDILANRTYLSSYHLGERQLPAIIKMLTRKKFPFITGYPSSIAQIAAFMLDNNISLPVAPRLVSTGSDALDANSKRLISEAFKCHVTDQYGMAEFCGNLSSCPQGHYHLDFECCHLEIENGRMIFTGFANPVMPFIRYDIGDAAKSDLITKPCTCGRHSPYILGFDGRSEDYITLRDGRNIMGLNQVLEYAVGVQAIQIVQNDIGSIDVMIVPAHDYNEASTKSALSFEFEKRLGVNAIDINYHLVPSVEKTPSGKIKAVINNIEA